MGNELYLENTREVSGTRKPSLILINKGKALSGGHLWLHYWWELQEVSTDDFLVPDSSGNFVKEPELPKAFWPGIINYALLMAMEVVEDERKAHMIRKRMLEPSGIIERMRMQSSEFQTGDPEYPDVRF